MNLKLVLVSVFSILLLLACKGDPKNTESPTPYSSSELTQMEHYENLVATTLGKYDKQKLAYEAKILELKEKPSEKNPDAIISKLESGLSTMNRFTSEIKEQFELVKTNRVDISEFDKNLERKMVLLEEFEKTILKINS